MRVLLRLLPPARKTWALFRESKLAVLGLGIVLAFAMIAIFAPVISPYSQYFEAPESDRFIARAYGQSLPPNYTYNPPVLGPTTPLASDRQGGVWLINSVREGLIFLDFVRGNLGTNVTPFEAGNVSFMIDITQDLGLAPPPRPPLSSVYYIVPGANSLLQQGPGDFTGALAFFADRDFVVIDPFRNNVIFRDTLTFDPVWTGGDPASAGEMLLLPIERVAQVGIVTVDVGPYRYFYAADATNVVVYEVTYVNPADSTAPSGRVVISLATSLSAPPFVYYNQDYIDRNASHPAQYRTGPGQAILLPLTNGTLEMRGVDGSLRAWIPLRLTGESATVDGLVGWTRASFPLFLYLPLRSASGLGIAVLDLSSLTVSAEYAVSAPGWEHVATPTSYLGRAIHAAFFDPAAGPGGTTVLVRVSETGAERFRASFPGRIYEFFEVDQRSKVYVFPQSGGIWMMSSIAATPPEKFPILPPATATRFRYAGALGGTLYGSGLPPAELWGAWTDASQGQTVVFQLLGTPITPLPPGTYPSGNTYLLGTDFRGQDILTQLFWGTRIAFIVGLLAALAAVGLGTVVGLLAGYFGRIVDTLLMRTADIFLVLPFLPIVLVLSQILGASIWNIVLVIGLVGWPGIARVIRAQVLTLKERPFIDAARVAGATDLRLIFYHIAPNVLPFSFLYMSLGVAGAIITEAALSFLGLGDASVISWGGMLAGVLTFGGALNAWWWLVPPGLAITVLSLGFYLLGRGFDEIVNPRLRRR